MIGYMNKGIITRLDLNDVVRVALAGPWKPRMPRNHMYFVRSKQALHRFVNNTPEGMVTDHINGNTLDNRKANLRTCTRSQNSQNHGGYSTNNSGHTNVSWDNNKQRWRAYIAVEGVNRKIGAYRGKQEAIDAYHEAVRLLCDASFRRACCVDYDAIPVPDSAEKSKG
jgi:hypothetical protein